MQSPVKNLREMLKLSQTQLANLCGISQAEISQIENGLYELHPKLKEFFSNILNDLSEVEKNHKEFMKERLKIIKNGVNKNKTILEASKIVH